MEMHWWCCECNGTNSSPDDSHLVCSQESCEHHLCSDCYNPQHIGLDRHLNDQSTVTRTIVNYNKSGAIVSDTHYDNHKMKKNRLKTARRLLGHYAKHSKIGRAFLSVWSYFQRKTGRKKDQKRIKAKASEYTPMPPIISVASNTQTVASTTHYYEPTIEVASSTEIVPSSSQYYQPSSSSQYYQPQEDTDYYEERYYYEGSTYTYQR